MVPDLEAKGFSFVVPESGASYNPPSPDTSVRGKGLAAARKVLGHRPLWLGRTFDGHKLTAVVVGTEAERYQDRPRFNPAPFARFDYGNFSVQEFAEKRTYGQEGPPEGAAVLDSRLMLVRNGLLIVVQPSGPKFRLDRARALAVAKALRPVD